MQFCHQRTGFYDERSRCEEQNNLGGNITVKAKTKSGIKVEEHDNQTVKQSAEVIRRAAYEESPKR